MILCVCGISILLGIRNANTSILLQKSWTWAFSCSERYCILKRFWVSTRQLGIKLTFGPSKTLTHRCQDNKFSYATMIQGLPSASFHYRHQIGRRQWEMEAYSTMFCSSSARSSFIRKLKELCIKVLGYAYEILPRLSWGDYPPRTTMEESGTCWSHPVLCSIFLLNQTEALVQEKIWMDLSCLHIWMRDVSDVAGVVLDDSRRRILHNSQ